jgi:hypothetical protein
MGLLNPRPFQGSSLFNDSLNLSRFLSGPNEWSAQAVLQNLGLGIELIQLTHPFAFALKSSFRN